MKKRALCLAGFVTIVAAAGATPAAQSRTSAQLSAQDVNYLQTSISGDRFEVIGGKMAMQKGASAQIRALGKRLLKDHSKSLAEALAEAKRDGVEAPKAPTPSMVWELQTVGAMSGQSFDRAYASLETKDHQQDIEETTFEVQHGSDPVLKRSAKKELPMLRMHLTLSQKAARHG